MLEHVHFCFVFSEVTCDCVDYVFNTSCQDYDDYFQSLSPPTSVCDNADFAALCCMCQDGRK